jgi:hypothetical protein
MLKKILIVIIIFVFIYVGTYTTLILGTFNTWRGPRTLALIQNTLLGVIASILILKK